MDNLFSWMRTLPKCKLGGCTLEVWLYVHILWLMIGALQHMSLHLDFVWASGTTIKHLCGAIVDRLCRLFLMRLDNPIISSFYLIFNLIAYCHIVVRDASIKLCNRRAWRFFFFFLQNPVDYIILPSRRFLASSYGIIDILGKRHAWWLMSITA